MRADESYFAMTKNVMYNDNIDKSKIAMIGVDTLVQKHNKTKFMQRGIKYFLSSKKNS